MLHTQNKTKKTSRNLKMYLHTFQKSKSDVKVGATRKSWNRIIHWRNETDLGLHKEGLGGESISIHMGQKAGHQVSTEEQRFHQGLPNHMESQNFLWWFRSKKYSSLLNIKEKHAAQELLVGSMASQKRNLPRKKAIPKKIRHEKVCVLLTYLSHQISQVIMNPSPPPLPPSDVKFRGPS